MGLDVACDGPAWSNSSLSKEGGKVSLRLGSDMWVGCGGEDITALDSGLNL